MRCREVYKHRLYIVMGLCCPCLISYLEDIAQGYEASDEELESLYLRLKSMRSEECARAMGIVAAAPNSNLNAMRAMQYWGEKEDLYLSILGAIHANPKIAEENHKRALENRGK